MSSDATAAAAAEQLAPPYDVAPAAEPYAGVMRRTGNDEADVYAPWIHNPWQTYLKHRAVANSMIVEALEKL